MITKPNGSGSRSGQIVMARGGGPTESWGGKNTWRGDARTSPSPYGHPWGMGTKTYTNVLLNSIRRGRLHQDLATAKPRVKRMATVIGGKADLGKRDK